ncbi:MAG TPA: hypothetical protein DCF68_18835 [Cyanothece sp. UBA12306]|nr:hypothetical protein [Cyanothece sp. UBA12306]
MNEQQVVGLAVGIVKNKDIVFLKGYGYADLESKIPVDPNRTLFRWASLAKPVTAIITTQLARAGIVNLDFPIETWLTNYQIPKSYLVQCAFKSQTLLSGNKTYPCKKGYAALPLPPSSSHITLRQLLSHQSGITNYDHFWGRIEPKSSYVESKQNKTVLAWGLQNLLTKPLLAIPRSEYIYTTLGYNLAGVVLEEASGKSYHQLLENYINNVVNLPTDRW